MTAYRFITDHIATIHDNDRFVNEVQAAAEFVDAAFETHKLVGHVLDFVDEVDSLDSLDSALAALLDRTYMRLGMLL